MNNTQERNTLMTDQEIKDYLKSKNYLYTINKDENNNFYTKLGPNLISQYSIKDAFLICNNKAILCPDNKALKLMFLDILRECYEHKYLFKFVEFKQATNELEEISKDKKFLITVSIFNKWLTKEIKPRELELQAYQFQIWYEWQEVLKFFEELKGQKNE